MTAHVQQVFKNGLPLLFSAPLSTVHFSYVAIISQKSLMLAIDTSLTTNFST